MSTALARPVLLALLGWLLLATSARGQPGREYFPLEVGHRWEYQIGPSRTLTVQATKKVPLGKVEGIQLEASGSGAKETEVLVVQKDGVYRVSADGKDLKPPLRILLLPLADDATWKVESVQDGLTIKGTFKVRKESIPVLGKNTATIVVHSDDLELGTRKAKLTIWFAPKIGPVRQHLQIADVEFRLELTRFVAGS